MKDGTSSFEQNIINQVRAIQEELAQQQKRITILEQKINFIL